MRAVERGEAVARRWPANQAHERAIALVLVVPREGAAATERPGATRSPVTTEGGILRFPLSDDGREDD